MRHRGFEPDYTLETLEKKGAFRVAYISVTKSVTHQAIPKEHYLLYLSKIFYRKYTNNARIDFCFLMPGTLCLFSEKTQNLHISGQL